MQQKSSYMHIMASVTVRPINYSFGFLGQVLRMSSRAGKRIRSSSNSTCCRNGYTKDSDFVVEPGNFTHSPGSIYWPFVVSNL